MTRTLYRAANHGVTNSDSTSFATCEQDARAYLDNPGFGGSRLWKAEVEIDEDDVLDLTDHLPEWIERFCDDQRVDVAIGRMSPWLQHAITDHGYKWVRVIDSYPEGAETLILVGGDSQVDDALVAMES